MAIKYEKDDFRIRKAEVTDIFTILSLIKGIAEYEKMLDQVENTPELIRKWLFDKKAAEAYIGEEKGKAIGFIIFFHNYSTFTGRAGLYVEDLFILPDKRGKGYGRTLLAFAAKTAMDRDCARMEWTCLNWNKPALDFYEKIGAVKMTEWTTHRLSGDTLKTFAETIG